jgi:hypothetical protein
MLSAAFDGLKPGRAIVGDSVARVTSCGWIS